MKLCIYFTAQRAKTIKKRARIKDYENLEYIGLQETHYHNFTRIFRRNIF